jgi:hypothetical protein
MCHQLNRDEQFNRSSEGNQMTDAKPIGQKTTAFVAAIRVMPNITRAAHAAKINKFLHYAKLKSSSEYAAAFQQALQVGYDAVSDVAVTRATKYAATY